jgi:hypothetical protein
MKYIYLSIVTLSIFLFLGCKKSTKSMPKESVRHYSIIWKYTIKPQAQSTFEQEYGSSGAWSKLFSESPNYLGSILHKSEDENYVYILIDSWTEKQSYEIFKVENANRYNQLSKDFELLYDSEVKIGAFYAFK